MAVAVQPSPASILSGPGYRVYEAGHSVQRWGTWIRYTSYVVICLACLGIATNLFKMVKGPEPMVVNDRPHETLRFPWVLYVFEELFNTCNSCLVLLQCKLALDAVKAKSRKGSWVLIKRVALLMLGHVFFYLLIFAVILLGLIWIVGEARDKAPMRRLAGPPPPPVRNSARKEPREGVRAGPPPARS